MKKILAFALAVVMVFALGVSAFADHAAPVSVDDHDFVAYQILTGEQNAEDSTLTEIAWGSGIDDAGFLAALQDEFGDTFDECETAADVAKVLEGWADNSENAKAFAALAYDFIKGDGVEVVNGQTELAAGYYLVVDETESVDEGDAYNLALLQLTKKGTFEINQKSSAPELEKKIIENGQKVDANNKSIGDTVDYEITTAVPAKAADYDYYYFIIRDTMTKGLTFDPESIEVTIGGDAAVEGVDYTILTGDDAAPYTFQIALIDAVANAGKAVVVDYSALLNEDAEVGEIGNPNKADLKYSNNPNEDYDGTQDENNPGFPDSKKNPSLGETPEDVVVTYTTQVKITKVDQDKAPLQGAEFQLTGDGVKTTLVSQEVFKAADNGAYWKLNDGKYTKVAPVTEDKMEPAAAGADKGYVEAEAGYAGEDAITVGGTVYRAFVPATDAGKDVFVLVEANADDYASTSQKYEKVTELVPMTDSTTTDVKGFVDENGELMFVGLSAGSYTLTETTVPDGYNAIDPIEFIIAWEGPDAVVTGEEECTWSVDEDDESGIVYNDAAEQFELQVVNQKGAVLPETGGIGTTIFYVVGGLMVMAAALLLITKKRMGTEA